MTKQRLIILLSITILITSCSSIRFKDRVGKDLYLSVHSSDRLSGNFKNSRTDTTHLYRSLYNNFNYDTIYGKQDLLVNIIPIDKNRLKIKLLDKGIGIDSLTIKGKYKNGYFKTRTEVKTKFIAGPLLWVLAENKKYIGLTNENNLIILNSGGSGFLLLIAFPIFAAGGGQTTIKYERTE